MAVDALEALAQAQPGFAWSRFDVEDQQDVDGDGDLFEPNGVLDHVIVVHAGVDQSDGGGAQGTYALWRELQRRRPGDGGYEIGGTGYKVANVTYQPESAVAGVIAHEYGHDLGLPDLYDSVGGSDTDTGFWDIMSSGSRSGRLNGIEPTNMGAWSKYVLGWVESDGPGLRQRQARTSRSGRPARRPRAPQEAVRITCPTRRSRSARRTAATTPGGPTTTRTTATCA